MASGYFDETKLIMFVLVDAASMTVTDTAIVDNDVSCSTNHIRLLEAKGHIFAVASRLLQFVDIFKITVSKLTTKLRKIGAFDVTDGRSKQILSLVAHPTSSNCVLLAGDRFKVKLISI